MVCWIFNRARSRLRARSVYTRRKSPPAIVSMALPSKGRSIPKGNEFVNRLVLGDNSGLRSLNANGESLIIRFNKKFDLTSVLEEYCVGDCF